MILDRKIRMNGLAVCCACSLAIIAISAKTTIASAPTALSGLGSFPLTRDTENDIIVAKVGKQPNAPYARSFIRGAKMMRLTAVFISWTFSRTTLVLLSPVIGDVDLTQAVDHAHGRSLAAAFCTSFHLRFGGET